MVIRRRNRQREGARFRYSAWDGTQVGFEYDAQDLFKELTDDLLYHGDLNAAMRRLMQQGFQDRDGNQMQGLRDMLDQLRERREEMLDQFDLGGIYDEINETLDDVVAEERDAIQDHVADTATSRQETSEPTTSPRHHQSTKTCNLTCCPLISQAKSKAYKATNLCRLKPGNSSTNSSNV